MFELINKVKEINPLVLHYTNEVTINDCANITLALGASPLMSYSDEEVEEIISVASSVVINIGTMNSSRLELFVKAGKAANKFNKPVVLDPVGVFATKTRINFVNKLLNEIKFDVIKGNVGKVIAEEFISFIEAEHSPLISFEEVFAGDTLSEEVIEKVKNESHTRLYLSAMNILKSLEENIKNFGDEDSYYINRFIEFLKEYPVDLMVGIMKDMKNAYPESYKRALENETFVESYFESYSSIRG